jgi:hypothetical protein
MWGSDNVCGKRYSKNMQLFIRSLGRFKESVHVRGPVQYLVASFLYSDELLLLAHPQSWSITPCRLSATAYSIYSQVPSISGGCLLHPQPEKAHDVMTGTHIMDCFDIYVQKNKNRLCIGYS